MSRGDEFAALDRSVPAHRPPHHQEGSAMRDVVLQVSGLSVDGYICEEETEFNRLAGEDRFVDAERDAWMVKSLWRAGLHIMGGTTYRSMAGHWPTSTEVFADVMNQIPKVAFSRTLKSADWPESRIVRGHTAAVELERLRAEPGDGEIIAHGGAKFASSLAAGDLVDEYRLIVYPVVAGGGTPLFPAAPRSLRLVSSTAFPSGCLALVYRRG